MTSEYYYPPHVKDFVENWYKVISNTNFLCLHQRAERLCITICKSFTRGVAKAKNQSAIEKACKKFINKYHKACLKYDCISDLGTKNKIYWVVHNILKDECGDYVGNIYFNMYLRGKI